MPSGGLCDAGSLSSSGRKRGKSRRSLPSHPKSMGMSPSEHHNDGKRDPGSSQRHRQKFLKWKINKDHLDSAMAVSPSPGKKKTIVDKAGPFPLPRALFSPVS